MTSRMQIHFSANTIRGVLHSLHMIREQYGILIWSLQRYGVHSMQLKPLGSESTCIICCRSWGHKSDMFVKPWNQLKVMASRNCYLLVDQFIFQLKGMTETYGVISTCWNVKLKVKQKVHLEENHMQSSCSPNNVCGLLQTYRWCAFTKSQLTGVILTQLYYCGEIRPPDPPIYPAFFLNSSYLII